MSETENEDIGMRILHDEIRMRNESIERLNKLLEEDIVSAVVLNQRLRALNVLGTTFEDVAEGRKFIFHMIYSMEKANRDLLNAIERCRLERN